MKLLTLKAKNFRSLRDASINFARCAEKADSDESGCSLNRSASAAGQPPGGSSRAAIRFPFDSY